MDNSCAVIIKIAEENATAFTAIKYNRNNTEQKSFLRKTW